jgi:aryl-alcohol dehydrogenase-like predicted oxidoreductase
VRYFGCSNFTAAQIQEVDKVCGSLGLEKPVAVQPEYNLLEREAEAELLPYCRKEELAVLAYSPLAGGFLTGKYVKNQGVPPPGSRAAARKAYWERIRAEDRFADLQRLAAEAAAAGVSVRQLALAWTVRDPSMTCAIVGASTPEQVAENSLALEMKVDEGTLARL